MNTLVLFDGKGCVSKTLSEMGHNITSLDILPLSHIDLPMNIMDFDPKLLSNTIFDFIWASPPCETFSMIHAVEGGGNRYYETIKNKKRVIDIMPRTNFLNVKRLKNSDILKEKQELHLKYLEKTIDIINFYKKINPRLYWFVENPGTGLMKFQIPKLIENVIPNKTTYCKYGMPYKKETNIFSNLNLNLLWCNDPKHHSDGFHNRWDKRAQKKGTVKYRNYLDRSEIPTRLIVDIFTQSEKKFQEKFGNVV